MKRKIEIIETAESMLAGGVMTADKRSRYPRWLVRSVLALGYDNLLSQLFENSRTGVFRKDEFKLDNYTSTFTPTTDPPVVVQYDSERGKYYSVLPKPIMELKDNEGIRLIAPLTNEGGAGIPVTQVASVIRQSLVVSQINPRFTYKLENDRVYYEFPVVPITELIMKLVVRFESLDDYDFVDEPAVMTGRGLYTIYNYVKDNLIPIPVTKQTENNDPNE